MSARSVLPTAGSVRPTSLLVAGLFGLLLCACPRVAQAQALAAWSLRPSLSYTIDLFDDPDGGFPQGAGAVAAADVSLGLEFTHADGDRTEVQISAHRIDGRGFTAAAPPSHLLPVSSIDAPSGSHLANSWIEHEFARGRLSVRAGRMAPDEEFFTSDTAATFVNSTHGWPVILAANLPNGGGAYPFSASGVRFAAQASPGVSFAVAILGEGAGPRPDPPTGGAFLIAELAARGGAAQSGRVFKLGVWRHTGEFHDRLFDHQGRRLADPASDGQAARRRGDLGGYVAAEATLWRSRTGPGSMAVFARGAAGQNDRDLVSAFADAGLRLQGPFAERPWDSLGLSIAFAQLGSHARATNADWSNRGDRAVRPPDREINIELTYRAAISPRWAIQPDVQIVMRHWNTAGQVAAGQPHAAIVGVRNVFAF